MVKCTVKVPATTANLGPGFDSVGCAFALYNTLTFELTKEPLSFVGCATEYANEDNLAFIAFKAVYTYLKTDVPSCRISFDEIKVPVSRGLGSSAALIVAGAVAANFFTGNTLDKGEILKICNDIEGHPDNLSPAIYGGLTASFEADGVPYSVSYNLNSRFSFIALVPDFHILTKEARQVLPANISLKDAVFNTSHLAVLLKALEDGNVKLVSLALADKFHQPYRKALINGYETVKKIAIDLGAISFCISGSGPTCLIITEKDFSSKLKEKLQEAGLNWQVIPLPVDFDGATVI
ncbi:MAG: homoserine kinase [Ruminococcaceae bacterium]|nr:homoserine kinase [Oscillospiraceae bacterium]